MTKIGIVVSVFALALLASTASQAAWCVWPGRHVPPHPCRFGGVPVAPSVGYWVGDDWFWGPRPAPGVIVRVAPFRGWGHHDWDRARDWR